MLTMVLAILMAVASPQDGNETKDRRWKYKEETYSVLVPKTWWVDPFSSSSVCDCPGMIAGSDEGAPKVVIYATDAAGMEEQMRKEVWSYVWDEASGQPFSYTNKAGVQFRGAKGQWKDAEDGHTVVCLEAQSGKKFVRLFFFGTPEDMQRWEPGMKQFLDTFKWEGK